MFTERYFKPNTPTTDDGDVDTIVVMTASPELQRPPSLTPARDAVLVDAMERPAKRRAKALRMAVPLHKFIRVKEKLAVLDYAERVHCGYQAMDDLGNPSTRSKLIKYLDRW